MVRFSKGQVMVRFLKFPVPEFFSPVLPAVPSVFSLRETADHTHLPQRSEDRLPAALNTLIRRRHAPLWVGRPASSL